MKNTNLNNLLQDAGLNDKESEIYLAVLELGQATILEIAKYSRIKRSTIYEIIPLLENKGIIKKTKRGKKISFAAESPKSVLALIREKEARFREAMPELLAIFKSSERRPSVFFYQGRDEIQGMYEDTLREKKTIYNYTSIINLYKYLDREWVQSYIDRRTQIGLETNIIAVDSPEAGEWVKNAKKDLRNIKLIPNKSYDFSADVQIYGNKVIVCTFRQGEGLFGLLIEDENIAKMQKMVFDMMWSAIGAVREK